MFTPLALEEALLHPQRVPWDSRDPTSSHWREGGAHGQPESEASFQQGAGRPAILHGEKQKKNHILRMEETKCNHVGFQPERWQGRSSAECLHAMKCGSSICRGPIR